MQSSRFAVQTVPRRFLPKLVPPRRRSDTVRRERLHALLSNALDYDVTVVSAPAGYGKSTLAVDWCTDAELRVAWLSLDRQDTDPLSLVANLVGAMRLAFPEALSDLTERLEAGAVPADAPSLVNEFAASVHQEVEDLCALVIDDLHVIDGAPEALEVIDTLVQAVPISMRVYLLSRTWPDLPSLARLTAQRRAISITTGDLVFLADEANQMLDQSRVTDASSRAELMRRADGWAAALAVMADHYDPARGAATAGTEFEFILGQFIDHEVLERLSSAQVELLRSCSVMESFDLELARQLSGDEQAAGLLRELEQTNHFLTRLSGEDADWYRMHALVREHLVARLEREAPERLLELRRSAAALCARRGQTSEAVELAMDAHDWPAVVRELYELREPLYQRGAWSLLVRWLDRLPGEVMANEPGLALTRARLAIKFKQAQEGLARLEALDAQPLDSGQRIRVELYRAVAYRHLSRLDDAVAACRRSRQLALEDLPDDDPLFAEIDLEEGVALGQSGRFAAARERLSAAAEALDRYGDHHRAAEAHDGLGITLYHQGWLAESMAEFTSAQRRWRMLAEPQAQVQTMNNMGNLQHMLGELETARDTFNAVIERARSIQHDRSEAFGKEGLATVERDLGRLDQAVSLYTLVIHEAQQIDDPPLILGATYGLAMCYRERGDYARARTLLEHGLRSAEQAGALLQQARFRIGLAATLLSEQQFTEAIPVLDQAIEQAEESGAPREQAVGTLLLACACYYGRRRAQTTGHLEHVHELVERLGYDQFLHAEARQMPEVLAYGASRRVGAEYFRALADRLRPALGGREEEDDAPGAFRIRAEAFGVPRVSVDGRPVADLEWRSERSKELFFYLLHRQQPLRKEEIALQLWPDVAPKQLNSSFHSTLYRLRRAIHPRVVIQTDGGYQVNPDFEVTYDVLEFERHARAAQQAQPGSEQWSEGLTAAISLYRGPFGRTFDSEWAEEARRRYEDLYLICMLALCSVALRRGDLEEAVTLAEAVLAVDPLNEEATHRLMRVHARRGHLDLASRAYRRLYEAMEAELAEEPSERLQRLYGQVLSGEVLDASLEDVVGS